MLAFMTFGFALTVRAQFSDSEEVYCYQYVKTVDENGVISKDVQHCGDWICIYFHDGRETLMRLDAVSKNKLGTLLTEDADYLLNLMKQRYYQHMKSQMTGAAPLNPNGGCNYLYVPHVYKYYSPFSTGTKYTYRLVRRVNNFEEWGDFRQSIWTCHSFSIDKSELILWSDATHIKKREHYIRVDINSLKPNLDFLD